VHCSSNERSGWISHAFALHSPPITLESRLFVSPLSWKSVLSFDPETALKANPQGAYVGKDVNDPLF
jgi:hypothetical protein